MSLCYLCGAMSCYKGTNEYEEKAVAWRYEIRKELSATKMNVFDPTNVDYEGLDWNDQCVVELNFSKLDKAACLIVNVENIEKSPGSLIEIALAFERDIPIIWFGKLTTHSPHVRRMLGFNQYNTLKEALKAVKIIFELEDDYYSYEDYAAYMDEVSEEGWERYLEQADDYYC